MSRNDRQVAFNPAQALQYLEKRYGMVYSDSAFKRRRHEGKPPRYRKPAQSRRVIYLRRDLDTFALGAAEE